MVREAVPMLKYLVASVGMCVALSGMAARASHAGAHAAPSFIRQVTGHGLHLQLTVHRLVYPRDALARVTITLTNISTRAIPVTGNDAPMCLSGNGLGIEVRTRTGHIVYPPAAPWELASCGPAVFPTMVPPGKTLIDHPLIVLRGSRVRAVVTVGPLGRPVAELRTPPFALRLMPRDRPPFTFSTNGGTELTIGPLPWKHAALYYVESGRCLHPGDGGFGTGSPTWQRELRNTKGIYSFGMACDGNVSWAFTGGVPNHSVVSVSQQSGALARQTRSATRARDAVHLLDQAAGGGPGAAGSASDDRNGSAPDRPLRPEAEEVLSGLPIEHVVHGQRLG